MLFICNLHIFILIIPRFVWVCLSGPSRQPDTLEPSHHIYSLRAITDSVEPGIYIDFFSPFFILALNIILNITTNASCLTLLNPLFRSVLIHVGNAVWAQSCVLRGKVKTVLLMQFEDDNSVDQRAESWAPHVSVNNSVTGGVSDEIYSDKQEGQRETRERTTTRIKTHQMQCSKWKDASLPTSKHL